MSEKLSTEDLKAQLVQEAQGKTLTGVYKFPTEEVTLPSKGIIYEKDSLLSTGIIEMKYMSAKEEDILTSKSLIQNKTVLDKLFKSLIVTPIKYEDLLLGDKNKIMIATRILGYGKDYTFKYKCPNCGLEQEITVDLNTLTEKEFDEKDCVELNKNEFEFELPRSKRVIKFKLLTHSDYKKIQHEINGLRKNISKTGVNPEASMTLKQTIIGVDDKDEKKDIIKFVDTELLAIDSKALRKEIKRISPDVNLNNYFVCDNSMDCSYESDMEIPIDINFFWPEA